MKTVLNIASLILLGIILQIGGAYIVNAAVESLNGVEAASQYRDYMAYIRSIEPKQFANIIFVAPLVEEIVFRLIFLRAGKMVLPFWAANLAQAALFAIYHNVTIQRVYVFVMGLIIGAVFYYCPLILRNTYPEKGSMKLLELPNSLIGFGAAFILHMVINTAGLFLAPLLPADIPIAMQYFIGIVMMAIACAAVYKLYRQQAAAKSEAVGVNTGTGGIS